MKKALTIGVDVSPLNKPLTGIGQYTYYLLSSMIKNSNHQWVLFTDKPLILSDFNNLNNVKISCYNRPTKLTSLLFRILRLPFYFKQLDIDTYWSPCNILPFKKYKTVKYIVTFHDRVHKVLPHSMTYTGKIKAKLLSYFSLKKC